MDIDQIVKDVLADHQIGRFGWSPLKTPVTFAYYEQWLEQGFHGNMKYLQDHAKLKRNPQALSPLAHSAIVFAIPYWPTPEKRAHIPTALNVARYARGDDYHIVLKKKLNTIITDLKVKFPEHDFVAYVDSGPVLERDLAVRAGLGWVGKNTCLIREGEGSFFFIAEIYTSLDFTLTFEEAADRCGTCTRCIDACPTGALISPRVLDATKCLSYLTIESRENPNVVLREQTKGQFYGCDICQEVCPWNIKEFPQELKPQTKIDDHREILREISEILQSTNSQIEKRFHGTALLRARPWMHKRNAIWMAVHYKFFEALPFILRLADEEKLIDFVKWAHKKLSDDRAAPN